MDLDSWQHGCMGLLMRVYGHKDQIQILESGDKWNFELSLLL